MSDEHSDGDESANEAAQTFDNFGDYARFQAASHARVAESLEQNLRKISAIVRPPSPSNAEDEVIVVPGPSVGDILTTLDQAAQRTKLRSSLNAAQAVAWDHMQANGGPEDPAAYADYGAATEFHTALIPDVPGAGMDTDREPPTHE